MSRQAIDPETRAQALELARTEGVAVAAERTGVSAGTIRVWLSRSKAKAASPAEKPAAHRPAPSQLPTAGLTEYEAETMGAAKRAVEKALRRLEELLPQAKGVQSVAISAGILMDKVERLNEVMAEAQEREVRLSESYGELIAEVIRAALEAHGVAPGDATARIVRQLLTQVSRGEPLAVSPAAAEEAVAEYRARVRREVRAELEREQREREREQVARLALPAPLTSEERLRRWQDEARGHPESGDGPSEAGVPAAPVEPEVEVVTGEVVEEQALPSLTQVRPGHLPGLGGGWTQVRPGHYRTPGDRMPRWR